MKSNLHIILLALLVLNSCKTGTDKSSVETWKQEIIETEQKFAAMAESEGIPAAFFAYAAEDAVLMRNNSLVIGKADMAEFLSANTSTDNELSLTWEPDFVDVSSSGDLGYTYGHYTVSHNDSSGSRIENTGVFHTVWKRQADNSWRFVWD
ncbi:MAG: nuclear transport factor 2 family protein [Bacteroidetes bacterium]|nr:nuclear transport factor 2 family protein [Bacteroidota bacterium]